MPAYLLPYLKLAEAALFRGDVPAARERLAQYRKMWDREDPEVPLFEARMALESGQPDEARIKLAQALALGYRDAYDLKTKVKNYPFRSLPEYPALLEALVLSGQEDLAAREFRLAGWIESLPGSNRDALLQAAAKCKDRAERYRSAPLQIPKFAQAAADSRGR